VFYTNPLIKQEELQDKNMKAEKDRALIERIKNSKLKRRLEKEKSKAQEEAQVGLREGLYYLLVIILGET
jgi:hypothetical protein